VHTDDLSYYAAAHQECKLFSVMLIYFVYYDPTRCLPALSIMIQLDVCQPWEGKV